MGQHAPLMPSAAPVWMNCGASVSLQAKFPETGFNESSEEGTAAHEVAGKIIADFIDCGRKGHHFKREDFLDRPASNGILITDEMLDAVEVYVRDVLAVSDRYDGLSTVVLEHPVFMPMIHADNWGTMDSAVLFYNHAVDTAVVSDYKHGWGLVEAVENWQLIDYGVGLVYEMYQRNWKLPKFIEFRIVQPRPHHKEGPVRSWTISIAQLDIYVQQMRERAVEAMGPNPRAIPGEWCEYCTGRHACQALRETNYRALGVITGAAPSVLSPLELGSHLKMLRRIKDLVDAQITGYTEQALSMIQSGQAVPFWEWERPDGRLSWRKSEDEIYLLGDMFGKELRKSKPITPTQAIDAGLPREVVESYASRTPGKIKLVPVSTKKSQALFGAPK